MKLTSIFAAGFQRCDQQRRYDAGSSADARRSSRRGSTVLWIVLLFVLVALLALLGWMLRPPPSIASTLPRSSPLDTLDDDARAALEPAASTARAREADSAALVETNPAISVGAQKPPPPLQRVLGRVLDARGNGIAAVSVVRASDTGTALATSASDGAFELETRARRERLTIASSDWIAIFAAEFDASSPGRELLIVAAKPIGIAGHVVDAQRTGVAKAHLSIPVSAVTLSGFPFPLGAAAPETFAVQSGDDGSFAFERAPAIEFMNLETEAAGFRTEARRLPTVTAMDLVIELVPVGKQDEVLEGFVLHADGAPAKGARVHLAGFSELVNDDGAFRLKLPEFMEEGLPLAGTKPGFQAAVLPDISAIVAAAERHPAPVRLVLGAPALTIAGKVVDAEGRPLAKWHVALLDPTALSNSMVPVRSAERETLGAQPESVTDTDGAFEIGGLSDREYRLQAYTGATLVKIESDPIRAGTRGLELRLAANALVTRITGSVLARDGTPLAGVFVNVQLVNERAKSGYTSLTGSSTRTAQDGSFTLEKVPRRHVTLNAGGDAILSLSTPIEELDLGAPIVLRPLRRCHFRVEGGPLDRGAIGVHVLGPGGETLTLLQAQHGGMTTFDRTWLSEGGTPVLAVSEEARRVVFTDPSGQEIKARDVRLSGAEVTIVRY